MGDGLNEFEDVMVMVADCVVDRVKLRYSLAVVEMLPI